MTTFPTFVTHPVTGAEFYFARVRITDHEGNITLTCWDCCEAMHQVADSVRSYVEGVVIEFKGGDSKPGETIYRSLDNDCVPGPVYV